MNFPVTDYGVRLVARNTYRYSIDLELAVESDLSKKLKVASMEFWEISTRLTKVSFTRGLSSPVTMQLFLELTFSHSPGSVWDIWLKVRRVLSPLGKPKLQGVKVVSAPAPEKDLYGDLSNFLLLHWKEFAVGFLVILFIILILKKRQ